MDLFAVALRPSDAGRGEDGTVEVASPCGAANASNGSGAVARGLVGDAPEPLPKAPWPAHALRSASGHPIGAARRAGTERAVGYEAISRECSQRRASRASSGL